MTTDDPILREFFEEERRRDSLEAPPFHELAAAAADGPETRPGPRRGIPLVGTIAAVAAAALGFVLVRFLVAAGAPSGDDVATSTPPELIEVAGAADLDTLCDAALAALDELESEARMESSTDALLRPLDPDPDATTPR